MNYREITKAYYSHWLGQKDLLQTSTDRLTFLYSEERDRIPYGYSSRLDLYILRTDDKIFVSYGQKAQNMLDEFKKILTEEMSAEAICQSVTKAYGKTPAVGIKYLYVGHTGTSEKASVLTHDDYNAYLDFFKALNPRCQNTEWVKEYFDEMAESKMCCGVMEDRKLVSCTDIPGMPYMQDAVQEIGIHTLEQYRGKGYARNACELCIDQILSAGKCPLWSTSQSNIASQKLAEKMGFSQFAHVITLTL